MKVQIDNAILDRANQDSRKALHHLTRLGMDVHVEMGVHNIEYATVSYDGHDPNPDQAAEVSSTIQEIGRHLLHPVKVVMEYAGQPKEFFIGPNAEKITREAMLRKAAYYASLAGEPELAATLRGKAGH